MLLSGRLSTQVAALGHGVVLAAGQWLTAVIGIAVISLVASGRLPHDAVIDFRLFVVFAIMLAMIATAPVLLPMTRLVADALHARAPERVPGLLAAALTAATLLALGLGLAVFGAWLRLDGGDLAATLVLLSLFVHVWVLSGLAGDIRHAGWVVVAYVLGGLASVVGAVWAGFVLNDPAAMALGYAVGLAAHTGVLLLRILIGFPFSLPSVGPTLRLLLAGIWRHRLLAVGGLAGAMGLWVDKWLIWISPAGQLSDSGLPYAAAYDSAVFAGLMSMIPGLALLVIHLETQFFAGFRTHMSRILGHATLDELEASAARLAKSTLAGLHRILAIQAGISLAFILLSPQAARGGLLLYQQVPVLMLATLAAWFLFLAIAASTLLVHLDMAGRFAAVNVVFLVGVSLGTAVTLALGERFLGAGLAFGCLVAGILAYWLLAQALAQINYQLFLASALNVRDRQPPPSVK
jgi:uncharacterized membrane protein